MTNVGREGRTLASLHHYSLPAMRYSLQAQQLTSLGALSPGLAFGGLGVTPRYNHRPISNAGDNPLNTIGLRDCGVASHVPPSGLRQSFPKGRDWRYSPRPRMG